MKFLGFMWNPLSWVMEAAAIMAIALANGGVSILNFGLLIRNLLEPFMYMLKIIKLYLKIIYAGEGP